MLTVIETPHFQKEWPAYWSEDERGEFAAHIARNPLVGDLIVGSGGIRKVRWSRSGTEKSGGVRVIYFARTAQGEIVLLTLHAKSKFANISESRLKEIARALKDD